MKTLILFFSLLLMVQAEITLDSSGLNSSIKKTTDNAYKSIRERKKRAAEERGRRYGKGSRVDYVMVNFESICGFVGCSDKNLQISGGPGHFSPSYSGAHSGAIHKGYNGALAGQYHWSAQFDNEFCSGTFYVSGQKSNITLSIHKGCSSFNVYEY